MGYSHGTHWDDGKIKAEIIKVKNYLEIERMPTRNEINSVYGNNNLSCAISKRKGYYGYAKELNLKIKKSCTTTGKTYEHIASDLLQEKGYKVTRMPQNFPYDLLINDCVKVDVKASHLFRGKNGNFYTFSTEKPFATCDIYLLIELDDNDNASRLMVVPSKFVFTNSQISVGTENSKYHVFTDRFDYIDTLSDFWRKI